jgi:homoserine O-acetyltransferase
VKSLPKPVENLRLAPNRTLGGLRRWLLVVVSLALASQGGFAQGTIEFAELGNLRLANGQVIEDCKIAYRTMGELNPRKTNVILFPTWFGATSEGLEPYVGPGKLIDTTKYFVITVNALGNGLSSSPSNSQSQHGALFPKFSVQDMVHSQHRLLTEVLGIAHLKAVVGISMGGMQAFQWIISHPTFMDKAVPMVGSPRLGSYDLLLWRAQLNAIERAHQAYKDPRLARSAAMSAVAELHELALATPQDFNRKNPRRGVEGHLRKKSADLVLEHDPHNWASQLRAMIDHDVSMPFRGSMQRAALTVKAKLFVVVAEQDHMVTPGPALEFAEEIQAQTLVLQSDCGHLAIGCEVDKVTAAVGKFLAE